MDQREIEIKVRVSDFEQMHAKLKEAGCVLSEPVVQDDSVFVNYDGEYTAFPKGANYLRIRRTHGKVYFTLKRGEEMDSIERETAIENSDQMTEALIYMGYHEAVRFMKTRQKTRLGDFEICLDEVDGLGKFIEVEKISSGDTEKVQGEMLAILAGWGVDVKERVLNGYDTLTYLKRKNS